MSTTAASVFATANWIWPDNCSCDLHNCYALFRKDFVLKSVPKQAALAITADQAYHLYINGRFVCRGPARGFQTHWPYDEVDVAAYLKKGRNVVAVRAFNPGRSNFQYISQGYAGLILSGTWGTFSLTTDKTWKARRQTGVARGTAPLSMQLCDQEHIDLNVEADNWMLPEYDDSGWNGPITARGFGTMPWFSVEPRMTPMLAEALMKPTALLGLGSGTSTDGYRTARDVAALRHAEDRAHSPAPAAQRQLPVRLRATGKGKYRSCLLDFGRTVVGNLTLTVKGAKGGEIIDSLHVETIDAATLTPDLKMPVWCRMAFGNRLVCRPGDNQHTFFQIIGFRYLELTVRDTTTALELDVELNWVGYPLERLGAFTSSDAVLNGIWETSAWTQQCCALDAYVDTPWREQAQWWGDARVQAWNTFHLNGDARLFRRGIHCIGSQTTPDGITYGHAPTMAHECILPDFTLTWILTLWDYYWQTGSVEPVTTHAATLESALDYFRRHTDAKTGLVGYDPRYWLFLDWCEIFKDGYPAVYNLWLLMALDKLAILLKLAGDKAKAKATAAWAAKVRLALGKLINRNGLMQDGVTFDGKVVKTTSIQSQTLAILTGLHPAGEAAMLERVIVPFIRGKSAVPKSDPSSYWCTYVFSVLAARGYGAEVVAFIRQKWAHMTAHGTTFEGFTPAVADNSCSHAWSAHPLYHLMQTIGGITQEAPEWKQVRFAPVFTGETGGATIPSSQGKITSAWKKTSKGIAVSLELPTGVTASVELPGLKPFTTTGKAKWVVHN